MSDENEQPLTTPVDQKKGRKETASSDLRALETVLRRTGRHLRAPIYKEGALWYGVTFIAVLLSGLAIAALFGEQGYSVGRWVMGLGLSLTTLGGLISLVLFEWRKPTTLDVARRVQRHSPEFRSDLVAALEFGTLLEEDGGASLRDQGFSEAMASAHVGRTTKRVLENCKENSLAHLVPQRDLTPPILAMTAAGVLLLLPFLFNAGWTLGVLTGERMGSPVVGERVAERSMVGYIDAVFVYPNYTGLDRQMVRLGTGHIEALAGTTAHFQVALMGEYQDLEIVIETGEEPTVLPLRAEGSLHKVSLDLKKSGHYWFRGTTLDGRPVKDSRERRLRVIEDEAPKVTILSHEGRVAVQPEDQVTFSFAVEDDFGIDGIHFLRHFEGAEDNPTRERIELAELSRQPREVEGEYRLDLQPLHLQPRDSLVISFEARDNNTATGPGVGRSSTVVLYVESPEDRHMENIAKQQEVMGALLMHLADFLENPVASRVLRDGNRYGQVFSAEVEMADRERLFRQTRHLHSQRVEILEVMNEIVDLLDKDPMMVPRNQTLFEGLLHRLERLQHEGDEIFRRLGTRAERRDLAMAHIQEVADYAARSEEELERGILSLEELLVKQKMDLVRTTAESIEELRERLRELIEQYRDSEDPELRAAIQREIERLRQRMNELMARMQMQLQEMPREHVNLEALQDMELENSASQMQDQLRSIEELLDQGDIDGALAALEQMEMGLDELTREMGDGFDSMEPDGISELDQAVAEMMDEVNQLEDLERSIEEETRALQEELRQARQEELEQMLEPLIQELLRDIGAQERGLGQMVDRSMSSRDQTEVERARRRTETLREMVEQRDLEQALERARQSQNSMRALRSTLSLSERYARSDEEGRNVRRSRQESEGLVQRADQITEKIEEFMNQAQESMQSGAGEQFEELMQGQQAARERAQSLRERLEQEGQRFPALEQQLGPSMQATEEAMSGAEEALRERRIQDALDQERRAIESLGELRQSMQQALEQQRRQDREQQGRQQNQDRVEIPVDESGDNRERLRREMMEGMREGRPGQYESQIERYFRSLVE